LGRELWKSFSVCNLEITVTVFWYSGDRREACRLVTINSTLKYTYRILAEIQFDCILQFGED
jgi:hypothetical protein